MKRKVSRAEAIVIMRAARAFRENQILDSTETLSPTIPEIILVPDPPEVDTVHYVSIKKTRFLSYIIDFIRKFLS
jgi:hypothetical protein